MEELAAYPSQASPSPQTSVLRFLWWNVESFAHYDPGRANRERWPRSVAAFDEKCRRIDTILRRCFERFGEHQLIGLAEITEKSARLLRDRILPDYNVLSLDLFPDDPAFHVAWLYRKDSGFCNEDFLAVPDMPAGTRPMAMLDHCCGDQ
jgi:hypothetical protein